MPHQVVRYNKHIKVSAAKVQPHAGRLLLRLSSFDNLGTFSACCKNRISQETASQT
jgi:hypothetical protein